LQQVPLLNPQYSCHGLLRFIVALKIIIRLCVSQLSQQNKKKTDVVGGMM